jgi:hypothetical protein
MTVDVDPPIPSNPNPNIVRDGVVKLLRLFNKYAIRATFFVPAVMAQNFPEIMESIVKQRHEVACHGLKHDPKEASLSFYEELTIIKNATEIIQSTAGIRPVGFRAPLFNVNENCWRALQKNDYVYDSSVVCFRLYKNHKILFTSRPFLLPASEIGEKCGLIEIPVSANPFLTFPLGGAFFRIFGSRWSKLGIRINFLFGNLVVFYIHPKDVDPRTKGRSWWWYKNTGNCMKLLEKVIKYAKQNGANFTTAYELAKSFLGDISCP